MVLVLVLILALALYWFEFASVGVNVWCNWVILRVCVWLSESRNGGVKSMSFRFGSVRWDASFVCGIVYVFLLRLFLVGKCVLFLSLLRALFVQEKQGFSRTVCRFFPATSAYGPCTLTLTLFRLHRY
jgi:hypothetical protein